MKKLYVSDLDGTLLQNDSTLSENTIKKINQVINGGGYFSFSTARSPASISYFVKSINFNIPLILMNGAMIYDVDKMKCINVELMDKESVNKVIDILSKSSYCCDIFSYENEEIIVYNNEKENDEYYKFCENKVFIKKYRKINNLNSLRNKNIFYFAFHDKSSIVNPIYSTLEKQKNIEFVYYNDTYVDDCWFLEIFSKKANKGNGLKFLKKYINADYSIAFGDNNNDIEMIKYADKGVAMKNAVKLLKENADEITGYNYEDAVAEYIFNDFYKK